MPYIIEAKYSNYISSLYCFESLIRGKVALIRKVVSLRYFLGLGGQPPVPVGCPAVCMRFMWFLVLHVGIGTAWYLRDLGR